MLKLDETSLMIWLFKELRDDLFYYLAKTKYTPPKVLKLLASDEYCYIRWGVAQNLNTPIKTLEQLATDEDFCVRWEVARNLNTLPKTLEKLATDENSGVRYWVASNPNTPHYIKKYLKIQKQLARL
jgi:3-methyladenine DNA glycosylase AlkC